MLHLLRSHPQAIHIFYMLVYFLRKEWRWLLLEVIYSAAVFQYTPVTIECCRWSQTLKNLWLSEIVKWFSSLIQMRLILTLRHYLSLHIYGRIFSFSVKFVILDDFTEFTKRGKQPFYIYSLVVYSVKCASRLHSANMWSTDSCQVYFTLDYNTLFHLVFFCLIGLSLYSGCHEWNDKSSVAPMSLRVSFEICGHINIIDRIHGHEGRFWI